MNKPSTRTRKAVAFSAAPVAVLLAGLLVWQGSQAAFTGTTRNSGNAWSTGQVQLTDDDNGVAGFTVENMETGESGEKCITVTSNSTVAGVVKGYVSNLAESGQGLADRIKLEVEVGDGGSFNDCTGFTPDEGTGSLGLQPLSTLSTVNKDYSTGGGPWTTTGVSGETKTYRGTWAFDTSGMTQAAINALQGSSVSIDLVWELQVGQATP